LAEENEQRQRNQLEIQAVSREAYDQTLNNLNIFKSEIDLIMAQIAKTEIRSAFDGRIGLKFVSDGSYINSSTHIATLVDNTPLKIEFSIPGKYAGRVQRGDSVNFYVQGIGKQLKAAIYATEPKVDPATRTLTMRALYNNSEQELLPGSFADIELTVSSSDDALLIPTEALIPELNGSIVFLYKNGTAQPVPVKTGLRTSRSIEIKEGLSPGDTLITSGLLELRPGVAVKISEIQ
ncbi:MAG: efflux RND transporter periplasmic adaptor subunit, partial [Calditrichaceae bacterium]